MGEKFTDGEESADTDPPVHSAILKARGYSKAKQDHYSHYLQRLRDAFLQQWNEKPKSNADPSLFQKIRVLGSGAFGTVYLVKHNLNGKYYALKMLEKEKIVKLKQVEHSYYEQKILFGLNFPFVIYMKYFFKDNVYLYYVLPFIAGGEMFTHLRKMGKYEEPAAKFYAAQVVLALEYLHTCELVYRDLKPENILLDRYGYIKLTDFGFCKMLRGGRTWTICGTPEYLAPEMILSKGYGKYVDWWCFGILIYEMAAGHPPFYASDTMRVYEKIVAGKYWFPEHFTPDIKDLIGRILLIDPSRRLGNLKDGVLDYKNHKWFRDVDWDGLISTRVRPPYVPKVKSPGDASNFDTYEEQKIKTSPVNLYEDVFDDF